MTRPRETNWNGKLKRAFGQIVVRFPPCTSDPLQADGQSSLKWDYAQNKALREPRKTIGTEEGKRCYGRELRVVEDSDNKSGFCMGETTRLRRTLTCEVGRSNAGFW